ncbi:hypothetical protein PAHAL_4G216900 [Panicum hallii]|uniref:Uncharacterized protein n=1 Tax=Panicum hallii TaxID=206008 RepID=A0A2S3HJJ0_9POAL|nr:hypothetical protein PAHAL_4G216900 [Panicum hallii]
MAPRPRRSSGTRTDWPCAPAPCLSTPSFGLRWRRARRRHHDFSGPDGRMRRAERRLDAQRNRQGNARPRQAETRRSPVGGSVDIRSATPRGARDGRGPPSVVVHHQSVQLAVDVLCSALL